MRIACRIPKVRNTHSEYVTLIAFPLQQWLNERASVLRCTYTALPLFQYIRSYLVRHVTVTKEPPDKEFPSHLCQLKCLEEFPHVPSIKR
jgi:hypothetical protein